MDLLISQWVYERTKLKKSKILFANKPMGLFAVNKIPVKKLHEFTVTEWSRYGHAHASKTKEKLYSENNVTVVDVPLH